MKTSTSLLFILSLALVAGALQPVGTAIANAIAFTDVPADAWYRSDVEAAVELGVITGYKDASGGFTGFFKPADPVTVGEALKIAVLSAGYDTSRYASPVGDYWTVPYLYVANDNHFSLYVSGNPPSTNAPATRAQVAALIADAFRVNQTIAADQTFYPDVDASTSYAPAIAALTRDGVVRGDGNMQGQTAAHFRPYDHISRAEMVTVAMRAKAKYGSVSSSRSSVSMSSISNSSRSSIASSMPSSSSSLTISNSSSLSVDQGNPASSASSSTAAILEQSITYSDSGFSPSMVSVPAGTKITFVNESSSQITLTADKNQSAAGFATSNQLFSGDTYSFTFTQTGTFGYHNAAKPSDTGTVIVK